MIKEGLIKILKTHNMINPDVNGVVIGTYTSTEKLILTFNSNTLVQYMNTLKGSTLVSKQA